MAEALSILCIAAGVALAIWWAVTDRPQKLAGFAAALLAVAAGMGVLVRARVAELTSDGLASIDAAAVRASADADAIRDLRSRLEVDAGAATDRAAENAAEYERLAAETSAALARTDKKIAALSAQIASRAEPAAARAPAVARSGPIAVRLAAGDPSVHQLEILATSLRGSGAHEVTLTTSTDDPEALEVASRLKAAIEAGGWIVDGVNQTDLEPPVSGLQVVVPVPLPAHATTLLGALGRAGLQPRGLAQQGSDKLEVLVGSRPPGQS